MSNSKKTSENAELLSVSLYNVNILLNTMLGGREQSSAPIKNNTIPLLNFSFEQIEEDGDGKQKMKSRLSFSIDGKTAERHVNTEPAISSDPRPLVRPAVNASLDKQEESKTTQYVEHNIPRNNLFSPILNESCVEACAIPVTEAFVSKQGHDRVGTRIEEGESIQMSPSRSIMMSQIVSPSFSGHENKYLFRTAV